MTIFFKSTRPDGTDFYTGEVDYAAALESGVPVTAPVIGLANDHSFPGPRWYHLATVPMVIGISELEEKRPAAWSSDLAEALISALEGNREAVLVQVADVLAPPLPGLDLDKESHG